MKAGNEEGGAEGGAWSWLMQVTERLNSFGGVVEGVEIHLGEARLAGGELEIPQYV